MTILISELSDTILIGFKQAINLVADWTVLPHSEKYSSFMLKCLRIFAFLQSRKGNKYVTSEGPIRRDEGQDQSLEDLACDPGPSDIQLAEQLALAIRRTTKDALEDKPKYYTYEEWVEFTRLVRFADIRRDEVILDEDEYGVLNWDWIGETSPMVASQTEPEWVLDRLCESLMRYLATQRQSKSADKREDGEEIRLKKEREFGLAEEV